MVLSIKKIVCRQVGVYHVLKASLLQEQMLQTWRIAYCDWESARSYMQRKRCFLCHNAMFHEESCSSITCCLNNVCLSMQFTFRGQSYEMSKCWGGTACCVQSKLRQLSLRLSARLLCIPSFGVLSKNELASYHRVCRCLVREIPAVDPPYHAC